MEKYIIDQEKLRLFLHRKAVKGKPRNSESQKRFGHRKQFVTKSNKDTPIKHGYHLEDYKRRVVYEHYYNDEILPFYVGQGKLDRAFVIGGNRRHEAYNNKVLNVSLVRVKIVAIDISKEDAENLEEELISKYKRITDGGTLVNVEKRTSGGFKECNCVPIYQFDKNGNFVTSFSSITQASKQTGIAKGNIYKCAKGYSSYNLVGGYKWRYTKEFTNIEGTFKGNRDYLDKMNKYNRDKRYDKKRDWLNSLIDSIKI